MHENEFGFLREYKYEASAADFRKSGTTRQLEHSKQGR